MGNLNLDLTNVDTTQGGGGWRTLPSGEYRIMIVNAETRPLKSGNGTALSLECQVMDGEHAGKTMFESLNVVHSNSTAQQIAQRVLATLLDAIGIPRNGLTDTSQLCGKTVLAEVKRSKAREGYGDADGFQNSITAFASVNGVSHQPVASQPPASAFEDVPF